MFLNEKDYEHAFKSVVATEHGRKFVSHLIDICDVGHSFITDCQRMDDYNAGKRFLGERLLNDFKEYALDDYILTLKEDNNEKYKDKVKAERNNENE